MRLTIAAIVATMLAVIAIEYLMPQPTERLQPTSRAVLQQKLDERKRAGLSAPDAEMMSEQERRDWLDGKFDDRPAMFTPATTQTAK